MKRKLLLAGLSFFCLLFAKAQHYDFPSPVSFSLGLSGAADTTVWSLFSNPAGISSVETPAAGVGYHNAFLTEALSSQTAFGVVPLSLLNAGVVYSRYGNQLFNHQHISLSIGRSVAPYLRMGVRFRYVMRTIKHAETADAFTFDAGFSLDASEKVTLSVFGRNAAGQSLKDEFSEQPLASFLAVACNVKLSPTFGVIADIMHRNNLSRQIYGFGMSARVHSTVELRGAISAKPVRLAFGTTIRWEGIELTMGANHHDQLGLSSTAGIVWHFEGKGGGEK
ncbi:hypothetical protein [Marinilabilia sp.]|uniref:hypothetical protein n=1 Tax=Marinilabilia sp. TaxID=2021252 RepID=UPI0025BEAED1|nr:hypothetical protein [Marinilabilia sp.]